MKNWNRLKIGLANQMTELGRRPLTTWLTTRQVCLGLALPRHWECVFFHYCQPFKSLFKLSKILFLLLHYFLLLLAPSSTHNGEARWKMHCAKISLWSLACIRQKKLKTQCRGLWSQWTQRTQIALQSCLHPHPVRVHARTHTHTSMHTHTTNINNSTPSSTNRRC